MRGRDRNRLNMIGTVITFCEQNTSATAGIPVFAVVLGKIKTKRQEINKLQEKGEAPSTGVTSDVKDVRRRMCEQALMCASATLALAYSLMDHDLAAKVDYSVDDLKKMTKVKVKEICQTIKDTAAAHIGQLAGYGITATDLTDLQALIDEFGTRAQNPRLAIISRSQARRQVKELVRDIIDNLLERQLDKMANTLRFRNVGFCTGYDLARKIIDLGVTHAKVRGTVKDVNDVPLVNVRFSIYETGTQKLVKAVVSEADGTFKASPMPTGNFDFKWELEGYEMKTESNVRIGLGKELRRRVVMKRI